MQRLAREVLRGLVLGGMALVGAVRLTRWQGLVTVLGRVLGWKCLAVPVLR